LSQRKQFPNFYCTQCMCFYYNILLTQTSDKKRLIRFNSILFIFANTPFKVELAGLEVVDNKVAVSVFMESELYYKVSSGTKVVYKV